MYVTTGTSVTAILEIILTLKSLNINLAQHTNLVILSKLCYKHVENISYLYFLSRQTFGQKRARLT